MKNYLFSTTRQYNPGDEFILFGVMNLLRERGDEFNPVIFNRNQEVNQALSFLNPLRKVKSQSKFIKILGSFFRLSQVDNSFKDIHSLDFIDCVVFAGSPEWKTLRLLPLYSKLNKRVDIPVLFLGLGSFNENEKIPFYAEPALKRSGAITYRNSELDKTFDSYRQAQHLPCPALFSAGIGNFPYVNNKKVAITYGVSKASKGNHVSTDASKQMENMYDHLITSGYEVDIVCHYIDELPIAKSIFPNADIRYSFDSKDYKEIYQNYSLVITSRVHAVGICASLGIPGILIAHDGRASTAKGFLAEIVQDTDSESMNTLSNVLETLEARSDNLFKHKEETLNKYLSLLSVGK